VPETVPEAPALRYIASSPSPTLGHGLGEARDKANAMQRLPKVGEHALPPHGPSHGKVTGRNERGGTPSKVDPLNPGLLLLLVLTTAIHVPTEAVAQRAFVGLGAGASHIDPGGQFGTRRDTRPSIALRAGFGGRRVKVVLDWQRHGLGDDQPLRTDVQNGVTARIPQVLRTEFLLLGAQIYLTSGFYVRPAVGLGSNGFPVYHVPDGTSAESAEAGTEAALTAGLSAGYQLKLHRRFSLAIEASAMHSPGEDSSAGRTVVGIQLIPLLEF
jgi:hypothetical protein